MGNKTSKPGGKVNQVATTVKAHQKFKEGATTAAAAATEANPTSNNGKTQEHQENQINKNDQVSIVQPSIPKNDESNCLSF